MAIFNDDSMGQKEKISGAITLTISLFLVFIESLKIFVYMNILQIVHGPFRQLEAEEELRT